MKAGAVVMIGLVITLGALCAWKGGLALLADGLRAGGRGALPLVPLLAVVFLLAGFTEVLVPREPVARWFSDVRKGSIYLIPYSCRGRSFCPSCEKKRSLLWSEWLREEVLAPVPHRHVVLTMPRLLRASFRKRRELLLDLSRVTRTSLSLQRLVYLEGQQAVIYKGLKHDPILGRNFETMDPLEWRARMPDHIPDPGKRRTLFYS